MWTDFGEHVETVEVGGSGSSETFDLFENHDYLEYSLRLRLTAPSRESLAILCAFGLGIYHECATVDQLAWIREWEMKESRYTDTDIGYQAAFGLILWGDRPRPVVVELSYHDLFSDGLNPFPHGETPSFWRFGVAVNFAL